jgi:anti-sigma B factor antagonist
LLSSSSPTSGRPTLPTDMPAPLEVHLERRGATVVVAFAGDLDMATADAADEALTRALADGSTAVVVDLEGLQFMDSTGFYCLRDAKKRADGAGRRLAVLKGSGPPHRLLALTDADAVIEMLDDLDQLDRPERAPG